MPNVGHLRWFWFKVVVFITHTQHSETRCSCKRDNVSGCAGNPKVSNLCVSDFHKVAVSRYVTFDELRDGRSGEVSDTADDLLADDDTISLNVDGEVAHTDPRTCSLISCIYNM